MGWGSHGTEEKQSLREERGTEKVPLQTSGGGGRGGWGLWALPAPRPAALWKLEAVPPAALPTAGPGSAPFSGLGAREGPAEKMRHPRL